MIDDARHAKGHAANTKTWEYVQQVRYPGDDAGLLTEEFSGRHDQT
jgi:hypothetical protein